MGEVDRDERVDVRTVAGRRELLTNNAGTTVPVKHPKLINRRGGDLYLVISGGHNLTDDTGFDDGEEQLMAGSDEVPPIPVTPSSGTERPEGLAFDVEKAADLSGVPVGEQTPADPGAAAHTEATVREGGGGPPAGLAVPQHTQPPGDDPADRR